MNTQIILIIVAAFIIGIIIGSIFKKKPSAKKSEEESIKVAKKSESKIILPDEIFSFIIGDLTEEKENYIVKVAKDDKKVAIRIVERVKNWNNFRRGVKKLDDSRGNIKNKREN